MRMSRDEPSGRPGRAKRALLGGLVLGLLGAGCAKAVVPPSGAITSPTGIRTHQALPTGTASSDVPTRPRPSATSPRPHTLVAVTSGGNLQSLDPSTGHAVSSLASGATGDEVSLTPDRAQVFFENTAGCFHQILSVPIGGGEPTLVAAGSHPTVSPDGTKFAYTVEPLGPGCPSGPTNTATLDYVVVQPLPGGTPSIFSLPPPLVIARQARTVNHLSWAPDNRRLAVSIDGGADNKQWNAFVMDTTTDHYYVPESGPGVPVEAGGGSYYREAVFAPNGNLFANVVCCSGAKTPTTTIMAEVDLTGKTVHEISSGLTDRDHTSLAADAGGHWVLYLAGSDLVASGDSSAPIVLSTAGFLAADW
jgi:hypothetical protein